MNYLSPKKKRFVDFIENFINNNHRPPTFVEIMSGLQIKSLGTVNWYVNELEKDDVIKRMKGKNGKRALSVLEKNITNKLPLLGLISAGYPLEIFETLEYLDAPVRYIQAENYILKVNGDSMIEDQIQHGDYIIVKKTVIANNGDTVVAIVNNEAILKRYYITAKGIELHPKNKNYKIISIKESDDFYINGIVLAVFREYI